MGLLETLRLRAPKEVASSASVKAQYAPAVMDAPFGNYMMGSGYGGLGNYANSIIRQDAMSVPSVSRCRNLIAGTIATIPLKSYDKKTGEEVVNLGWVNQLDKRQPLGVTIAWICDSLFMYGVCYLQVTEVYQDDNRPAKFAWVQNDRVTVKYNQYNTEVDYYMINNEKLPMSGIGSLVTIQGFDQGLLIKAQQTIRAAIDIERAASIAAQTPIGSGYIRNNGADLPDQQVQGILAAWKSARQSRGTAYLSAQLEFQPISFKPSEMMYNDAKAYLALDIARACNIPATMIDAEMLKSNTYQNVIDSRKDFVAYTLSPFIEAISGRFSMDDLSPRGTEIRFAVDETFLRNDPITRLTVIEKLLGLGLVDVNQAKEMEGLSPDGDGEANATDI